MYTKNLNASIVIASQTLNAIVIMFFAVILAHLVWWVINPTFSDVYIEKNTTSQTDDSIKYIINRYPFGVISKVKKEEQAQPRVIDQIKLVGLYVNTLKDSMAFIQIGDKTQIFRLESAIIGNAKVKAINSDGIVITEDGNDATVRLESGHGSGANGGNEGYSPPSLPHMRSSPHQPLSSNYQNNQTGNQAPAPNSDEFKERRRKLIEEFAQHNQAGTGGANANGVTSENNGTVNGSSDAPHNGASAPTINNNNGN